MASEYIAAGQRHRIIKMVGDGNCFFRAIAHSVNGSQERHRSARQHIVKYITEQWNLYKDFIIGDDSYQGAISTSEDYRHVMSQDGKYGGSQEMAVAAKIYGIHLEVFDREGGRFEYGNPDFETKVRLLFSAGAINRDSGHFDVLEEIVCDDLLSRNHNTLGDYIDEAFRHKIKKNKKKKNSGRRAKPSKLVFDQI